MTDYNLADAISLLNRNSYYGGDTLILRDGIYLTNSLVIPQSGTRRGLTMRAAQGARVVITGEDGYPPAVSVGSGITLQNIWFGGSKYSDDGERQVSVGQRSTIQDCTFWGYGQCVTPGDTGRQNVYQRNRFVNCGNGTLYHDIYISAGIDTYDVISENIHVGGDGFKIHLWHNPQYVTVHANFLHGIYSDLAVQQGYHTITNNILWNCPETYWNAGSCVINKNIIGPDRTPFSISDDNNAADGNVFCNGQTAFGSNPQSWDADAIAANLGSTKAAIDAAIANLITKFEQATAEIYADATIEIDFAVLRGVIDTWKGQ